MGWNIDKLKVLGIYLVIINVVTFVTFAWDKHVAATGNDVSKRVPEAHLLALSLVGGSVGGLLAMYTVRPRRMGARQSPLMVGGSDPVTRTEVHTYRQFGVL